MRLDVSYITGVQLGFEFLEDPEEPVKYFSLDLLIIRLLFSWE